MSYKGLNVLESDELRTLFMRAATTSTGCYGDDVPVPCSATVDGEPAAAIASSQSLAPTCMNTVVGVKQGSFSRADTLVLRRRVRPDFIVSEPMESFFLDDLRAGAGPPLPIGRIDTIVA